MNEALHLSIPAKPEYLVLGRLVLTGLSDLHPIDADDLSDLKLALTEACTNSIRHAYGPGGGVIEIKFELEDDAIQIEVVDDGPGLDRVPAAAGDGVLDEGGLGLAIIQAVSDEIEIGHGANGTGSRLSFRKRLAGSPTHEVP